jgi:3-oxoacyl-[acyl-carrier-protein] synthase-3
MPILRTATITGTGMCVPPRVVTNDDLAKVMDTSDEWIVQRTGIKERRHVDEGTGPKELALAAANRALTMAGRSARDVDMLIVATLSPEHYFPGTAAFLQAAMGLEHTPSMDVRCQCSGFLYALTVADALIAAGKYERVLVVGVEVHSRGLDFSTRGREVTVIFGDGAGAALVEASAHPERGVLGSQLHSDGRYADKLWVEYPSTAHLPVIGPAELEAGKIYPQMNGPFVFKHAVTKLPDVIGRLLGRFNLTPRDIDLFLFHQANLRINEMVGKSLGIPPERTHHNIDRFGNCSSASIPMLLDECVRAGRLKPGDLVCLAAFGSGFTWGAVLLRW